MAFDVCIVRKLTGWLIGRNPCLTASHAFAYSVVRRYSWRRMSRHWWRLQSWDARAESDGHGELRVDGRMDMAAGKLFVFAWEGGRGAPSSAIITGNEVTLVDAAYSNVRAFSVLTFHLVMRSFIIPFCFFTRS
jgi:hypothetical protein